MATTNYLDLTGLQVYDGLIKNYVTNADVNIKVSYRRNDTGEINQYIVKSLSHDLSGGTTTWELMRFYPLYIEDNSSVKGTWEALSSYTWEELSNYTWEEVQNLKGK